MTDQIDVNPDGTLTAHGEAELAARRADLDDERKRYGSAPLVYEFLEATASVVEVTDPTLGSGRAILLDIVGRAEFGIERHGALYVLDLDNLAALIAALVDTGLEGFGPGLMTRLETAHTAVLGRLRAER